MIVKDLLPVLLMDANQSIVFRDNDGVRLQKVSYKGKKSGVTEASELAQREVMHVMWSGQIAYVVVR